MGATYEVHDHSILLPHLKRFWFGPLARLVPDQVSANTITLVGTMMSLAAFMITLFAPATRWTCALCSLLVFGYLTLDNIDGAHARRTGTSSPLGEFLDHWLDALNMACLFMGSIYTWRIPPDRAVAIMMLAVLSYTLTYWEQRISHRIEMGTLGNVEGILTVSMFYFAGAVLGPETIIETQLIAGQTVIDFFWYSAILNTAWTAAWPLYRVRSAWKSALEIFVPVLAVGAWYQFGLIQWDAACHIAMMLAPALAGRMLIARLTEREHIGPDRLLLVSLCIAALVSIVFGLSAAIQGVLSVILLAYAIAHVAFDFTSTVRRLGDHLRPGELLALTRSWPRG